MESCLKSIFFNRLIWVNFNNFIVFVLEPGANDRNERAVVDLITGNPVFKYPCSIVILIRAVSELHTQRGVLLHRIEPYYLCSVSCEASQTQVVILSVATHTWLLLWEAYSFFNQV
jgi:hypothetical protein